MLICLASYHIISFYYILYFNNLWIVPKLSFGKKHMVMKWFGVTEMYNVNHKPIGKKWVIPSGHQENRCEYVLIHWVGVRWDIVLNDCYYTTTHTNASDYTIRNTYHWVRQFSGRMQILWTIDSAPHSALLPSLPPPIHLSSPLLLLSSLLFSCPLLSPLVLFSPHSDISLWQLLGSGTNQQTWGQTSLLRKLSVRILWIELKHE